MPRSDVLYVKRMEKILKANKMEKRGNALENLTAQSIRPVSIRISYSDRCKSHLEIIISLRAVNLNK